MKKLLCILLTAMLLISAVVIVPISAAELDDTTAAANTNGDYTTPEFIGIQTRDNGDDTQDIRFVATVKNTKGKLLGFDIYANGKTYELKGATVYSSITAGDKTFTTPAGAEALFVAVIEDVPTNLTAIQFDVRTWVQYGEENTEVRSYNSTFEMNGKEFQKALTAPALTWATQGGTGTEANPYVLNQNNFVTFYNYYPNGGSHSFVDGVYYSLESDVVINDKETAGDAKTWGTTAPSVAFEKPMIEFRGVLDGNNHTISGFYLKTTGARRAALFHQMLANSVIKNIRVVNSYFELANPGTEASAAATIVGRMLGGCTVQNCYSEAIVKCNATSTAVQLGGLVGMTHSGESIVSNCVFAGTVEGENCQYVGGIIGKCNNGAQATITNCLNLGTLVGNNYVGGILGNDDSSASTKTVITNCINLSKNIIQGEQEWNFIVGGRQQYTGSTYVIDGFATTGVEATAIKGFAYIVRDGFGDKYTVTYVTLAEFLAKVKAGEIAGWTVTDGYMPTPIEGLQIELAPYLNKWETHIPTGQYNYHIGKGYGLTAEYTLLKQMSPSAGTTVAGEMVPWMQGGCADDTYYYACMITNDTVTPTKAVILQYDLATQTLIKVSNEMELGHTQDAVYNSNQNLILIEGVGTEYHVIDPETLTEIKKVTLSVRGSGMTYNAETRQYIIATRDTLYFYSEDFVLQKRIAISGMLSAYESGEKIKACQGMTSDSHYIYFLEYWQSAADQTDIRCNMVVYDIQTGSFIDRIALDMGREVENIFIWNNSFYIMCNNSSWNGGECYKINLVPNGTSTQPESNLRPTPLYPWATQGGDGSATSPYIINQQNFVEFYRYYDWNQFVNPNEHFKLGSDIIVNQGTAESWATAAPSVVFYHSMNEFVGTFDGDGHTISGLYVKSAGSDRAALFYALAETATVKNLRVENSYFEVTGAGHTSAATIAGRLNGGKIQNCYSSAILINSAVEVDQKSPADVSVGGIVGMVNGNNSLISNCSFAGTVNATVGIAGGIVGKINYGISGTQIQQCTNTGSVTGDRKGDIYGVNQGSGTSVTN